MSIVPGNDDSNHWSEKPVWNEDPGYEPGVPERQDPPFSLVHGDGDAKKAWVLLGTEPANAVVSCEPKDVDVYCLDDRGLSSVPVGLDVLGDKRALIFPHGDAATDHSVFEELARLGRWCEEEAATEVQFVWLSSDIGSYLGDRKPSERLMQLVKNRTGKKPAKAKPKAPLRSELSAEAKLAEITSEALEEGRPVINVNDDRLVVLNGLVRALREGCDRDRIYDLGGKLACTTTDENGAQVADLVDEGLLLNLLTRSAKMVSATERSVTDVWVESKTVTALFGRNRDFRPLSRIAPSPIVRSDNTIAATEGYDEATNVLLDLDGLELGIPNEPSKEDAAEAARFLLDEWLGDFPFASEADRTNVLAFILTYPLRELVSLVPLAVISAQSKGTGKSKLLGLIVLLFTRAMPDWDSLPGSEDETRKQITTLLLSAPAFLGFDESPVIGGKSINRLLTAHAWSDRRLGKSERVALPNRAVMAATGNNVQVLGDTGRRYYPIELFYEGEDPQDRPESDFRHPDVEAWTLEHRGELLTAVFTLIRAWQVAGRPKRTTSFGSFERWEAVVGGVIEHAGVEGFLDNLSEHRESADFDESLWVTHCEWLAEQFPDGEFTTRDVVDKMTKPLAGGNLQRVVLMSAALPPGVGCSTLDPEYPAKLGKLYLARRGSWSGGFRIGRAEGKAGGNRTKWIIELSPRLIAANGEAAATQQAERERKRRQKAARDLPGLEAKLTTLEAEGADPQRLKLARLEVENARMLSHQDISQDAE